MIDIPATTFSSINPLNVRAAAELKTAASRVHDLVVQQNPVRELFVSYTTVTPPVEVVIAPPEEEAPSS
jgi:hypothetical protein